MSEYDLADEGGPMIERPDEHEPGAANELYCWLPFVDGRECNAACVSFDKKSVRDSNRSQCLIINQGQILANAAAKFVSISIVKDRKEATAGPPPPEVK